MTFAEQKQRSLRDIASDIVQRVYLPPALRCHVEGMSGRGWIEDDDDYWRLARVHYALRQRHSHAATRLEQELRAMLALYSDERWQRPRAFILPRMRS